MCDVQYVIAILNVFFSSNYLQKHIFQDSLHVFEYWKNC